MDGPEQGEVTATNLVKVEGWSFLLLSPIKILARISLLTISCLEQMVIHSDFQATQLIM